MTKVNKWTLGLAAVGLVSLPAVVQAQTSTTEKPNQLLTALSTTTISGYVDTSAHWNPGSGNANTPAFAFNGPSKSDGFNLNVVNVVLEKPLDESTWSAGYKVDTIYGPNAAGWNNSTPWNSTVADSSSDFGIKQAYVALRAPVGNGLDLKMGTFDTIIGYEVFNAGSNPNYTRSWGYTIEPTQHTGLLASYQVNKVVGVSGGIVNTWAAGINSRSAGAESHKGYLGALTLTAPDSFGFLAGSALYLGYADGYNPLLDNDVNSYYAGATLATPIKGVKIGASVDYAEADQDGTGASGSALATALYASLAATEKLSFHLRAEYAKINSEFLTGAPASVGVDGVGTGGIPHEVLSLTGTIQYDLWANVLSRLEVRWDHALDGHPFGGTVAGSSDKVAGGADEKNSVIVAANIIYKF